MLSSLGSASVVADQSDSDWIDSTVADMTLEEKVGQLFMTYAYGTAADTRAPTDVKSNQAEYGVDNAQQLMRKYHLGGVIYFSWSNNLTSPQQIVKLSNGIQKTAIAARTGIPSLVGVDQEGGIVARIGTPMVQLPGGMALGAGRSHGDARDAARINGDELSAMGINWNFAPVADVNVNPANPVIGVRSFSENPRLASRMVAAQTKGYLNAGVAGAAKHFPGHGNTATDSHSGLPVIEHTRKEWEKIDRPPFKAAINAGVPAIMTGHISVPALDPSGDPATLSKPIMTGILRNQLGYDGVVITDALDMAGASATYGNDRVPVLALKAGVDMLLMPPDLDLAYNAVLGAVDSGELTEGRIDTSVRRILKLKQRLGLTENPMANEGAVATDVGAPEHLKEVQDITDETTTLVRNKNGTLPLRRRDTKTVLVTGWGVTSTQAVADELTKAGMKTTVVETGLNPDATKVSKASAQASGHDAVVVLTNRAGQSSSQGQVNLVRELTKTDTPVVQAAVRDPYDINQFPSVDAGLATYSYTAPALKSLASVLVGTIDPEGKLPVTIPSADGAATLYRYGHGLDY